MAGTGAFVGAPTTMERDGQVFVRPHDIEVVRDRPGEAGSLAVVRYIHAAGPQALDRVRDEPPGVILRVPRVGRREDGDPHRRAKTAGAATISIASTKK